MVETPKIVDTVSEHAGPLCELLNEIILIGGTTAYQQRYTTAGFLEKFVTGPDVICCSTALLDDLPVGFQTLRKWPELEAGWGDIATFVKVGGTAKGVGTELIRTTMRKAKQSGVIAINAVIRADNVGGLKYYDRVGFKTYDTIYSKPLDDGTLVDRICKQLIL